MQAQPVKVGTYNSRAVALAFYRSELWGGVMRAKRAERDSAKQAGSVQKVKELEKWGEIQQDLAHKQVFGSAPITNVLGHLAPGFPEIARAAGVAVVASDVQYAGASVQVVDITMHIVEWLKPDARTRAMVEDFLKKNPPPTDAPHRH